MLTGVGDEILIKWIIEHPSSISQLVAKTGLSETTIRKLRRTGLERPKLTKMTRSHLVSAYEDSLGEESESSHSLSNDAQDPDETLPVLVTELQSMKISDDPGRDEKTDVLVQEVFIPVHGFVWLSQSEVAIVDHPAFQRLRRIRQLGLAHIVYPGATHTRFEHVLGVLHLTQKIITGLSDNRSRADHAKKLNDPSESSAWGNQLTDLEKRFIRLGALLHDIGHLPFGHSLEDELGVLGKHDQEPRLRQVLEKKDWSVLGDKSLGELIEAFYSDPHFKLWSLGDTAISPVDIVISIILHGPPEKLAGQYSDKKPDSFAKDLALIGIRLNVCADIVGNTICADLLDYLHRDWHHIGKAKYMEDRLLHYMELRTDPTDERDPLLPKNHGQPGDRFVINLGRYPRLRTDAISLILELLESRYSLSEAVLFHRSKVKLTAMLERCLGMALGVPKKRRQSGEPLANLLLGMGDDRFLDELCLEKPSFLVATSTTADQAQRIRLAQAIRDRRLFRHVHALSFAESRPEAVLRFQREYESDETSVDAADRDNPAYKRDQCLAQLEADFGLRRGELAMYSPSSEMNSKLARVMVVVGGEMHRLDDFEERSSEELAAGHLRAQLRRHKRLWQVLFLIDPNVQKRLDFSDSDFEAWIRLLADYVQAFVIGTSLGKDIDMARREVRMSLAKSKLFKRGHGLDESVDIVLMDQPVLVAARTAESETRALTNGAPGVFPGGALSFWRYVDKEPSITG